MPPPPDWVTLRLSLTALDLGSISRAAERCGIAVSAAAKRLQDLEAEQGQRLLDRTARGVCPTAAGQTLARHARALQDLAARLADDMRAFAAGGLGSVRLHATTSAIAGHHLAEALAGFAAARPGVRVELREDTSLAILNSLLEGRADLGVVTTGAEAPQGLVAHPWRQDHLLAVMLRTHPLAGCSSLRFAEVLAEPMIGVLEGGALALLLEEQAQRLGLRPRYRFRVASTDAARRLVAAGHGLTVMPDGMIRPYAEALHLAAVPLAEPWAERRLRLMSRPAEALAAPARLLLDALLESCGPIHASGPSGPPATGPLNPG